MTNRDLVALEAELKQAGLAVLRNELMSAHTTYQIGGPADLFVIAESTDQIVLAARKARQYGIAPFILGCGAEILVADAGIRGVVINLIASHYTFQDQDGEILLWAEAGSTLQELARESVKRGLQGIHWAVDIPGSIGGAVVGNAGAFGGYISDCLVKVTMMQPDGTIETLDVSELDLSYRSSRCKRQSCEERPVILDVTLLLRPGDPVWLAETTEQYTQRRWERNPREPSCGSVFKRTANYPAGFLIDQCGLRGTRCGQAMISPTHANFIVNLGGAKAADVRALIELAQECVKNRFGEDLEPEVELVGEW